MSKYKEAPYDESGLFSKLFFNFASTTIKDGTDNNINQNTLPPIPKKYDALTLGEQYRYYREEGKKSVEGTDKPYPKWTPLLKFNIGLLFFSFILGAISNAITLYLPSVQSDLLITLMNPFSTTNETLRFVGLFLITSLVRSFAQTFYTFYQFVISAKVRNALTDTLYRKSLKLSSNSRMQFSSGTITNLITADVERFTHIFQMFHDIYTAPIVIIVVFVLLYKEMGWYPIAALAVLFIIVPANVFIAMALKFHFSGLIKKADLRVQKATEFLNQIHGVKLMAWEEPIQEMIEEIREQELVHISGIQRIFAHVIALVTSQQFLLPVVTFIIYIIFNEQPLGPQVVFPALSWFYALINPLSMISRILPALSDVSVGNKRIQEFLDADELYDSYVAPDEGFCVQIENGNFEWKAPPVPELTKYLPEFEAKETENAEKVDPGFNSNKIELTSEQLEKLPAEIKKVFTLSQQETFKLLDINLSLKPGQVVGVCGSVGSGKSSLLECIIGSMQLSSGSRRISSSVAYVPQEPTIFNATLRDNILFGSPLNSERYEETLKRCAMSADIKQLSVGDIAGDLIEIGGRGINLSGGQKQRLCLARAVYSDRDLIVLDDVLSAVDAHVGKHLVHFVLKHFKEQNKAVIFATHHIHNLDFADEILLVGDQKIKHRGTFEELSNNCNEFQTLLAGIDKKTGDDLEIVSFDADNEYDVELHNTITDDYTNEPELQTLPKLNYNNVDLRALSVLSDPNAQITHAEDNEQTLAAGQLTTDEELLHGGVKGNIWIRYFGALGSLRTWVLFCIVILLSPITQQLSSFILAWWTVLKTPYFITLISGRYSHLIWYSVVSIITIITMWIGKIFLAHLSVNGSKTLHHELITRVLHAPMSFFDQTPVGRVLNRFSADFIGIDTSLSMAIGFVFQMFSTFVVTFIVLGVIFPIFIPFLIPSFAILIWVIMKFRPSARDIRRLMNVSRTPIIEHFKDTLGSLSSIKSFDMEDRFLIHADRIINFYSSTLFHYAAVRGWVDIRSNVVSALLITGTVYLATIVETPIEYSAIAISSSLSLVLLVTMVIVFYVEAETAMNAVERILAYMDLTQEKDHYEPQPPENWVNRPTISFRNVDARYRDGLELVLKNVNAEIEAGEKIAVVGRTGSGKSTMLNALFRTFELAEGKILIDGLDHQEVGLQHLRKAISVIPQTPMMFNASLRHNLDPFKKCTDDQLLKALELANLKAFVDENGLDYEISEAGANLSVGQRQLVCLARALLDDTRILVLDEATSSIDNETDKLVQSVLRNQFQNRTIITIAHRLKTIVDYDRVMCFDHGELIEFDSLKTLAAKPESLLSNLIFETGPEESSFLRRELGLETSSTDFAMDLPHDEED
eukprot:TRINITY_DN3236_c1_g1_i3.p1 TRINITY_DN3236_c1_g1~~TRINITY_DN3236_c1_g1_i3.p1  ORF type:complete len:1372 (+),score=353.24 TRINITY_DN3236_c1_g1_i3:63-4178(+)